MHNGYSWTTPGPPCLQNKFVLPRVGSDKVYVEEVHYSQRYAICGYGGGSNPISHTSIGGECRNQAGTACIMHNGYFRCSDTLNELYA